MGKNIVNHFTIPKLFLTLRRKRCPLFATGKQDDDAEKSDRENAAESGVAQSRYITEIGSN